MTSVQECPAPPVWDHPQSPDPERIPAYLRTGANHSGIQPFEAKTKLANLLGYLAGRKHTTLYNQLYDLLLEEDDPRFNGTLTPDQANLIAKMTRSFIRQGDRTMTDVCELALNASGLLLNEVLPHTVAQSLQADQEARRMQELKFYFYTLSPDYELPF